MNYINKLSYFHRELAFGYIDYNEDKNYANKYNIFIRNDSNVNLMMYNYYEDIYYIHPLTYNTELFNEKELYNEINNIITDLSKLSFTSGSIIKDLIRKVGLNKINLKDRNHLMIIVFTIISLFGGFYYLFFCENSKQLKNKKKKD